MGVDAQEWFFLNEHQLWLMTEEEGYPGAEAALEQVRSIRTRGHTPGIYFSEQGGFAVFDEDDPDQRRQSEAIGKLAMRFQE